MTRRAEDKMQNRQTAEIVFDAVQDLHNKEQIVTRDELANATGLKLTVIDDRLAYLVDNGRVMRVQRGVFVPAFNHHPARHISRTILPDGTNLIEIGETVMHLTPREARMLGDIVAAPGAQMAAIELGNQSVQEVGLLKQALGKLQAQLADLKLKQAKEEGADA